MNFSPHLEGEALEQTLPSAHAEICVRRQQGVINIDYLLCKPTVIKAKLSVTVTAELRHSLGLRSGHKKISQHVVRNRRESPRSEVCLKDVSPQSHLPVHRRQSGQLCQETCRMGGHPERVRLAIEERGDQKDDGGGRRGYPDAGGLHRAGGYRKAEAPQMAQRYPFLPFCWLGSDPQKKTVCIYGHLDVQPAALEDGWVSEPFTLVERKGKLYGRGSTDDKGPVAGWMNALEAYQKTGQEILVNLQFCLEGMEESGSEGLDELLFAQKDKFFKDVDYVCISDNYWLGKNKPPCITYGLRGICYFFIEVEYSDKDLHFGVYGGSVHKDLTDLISLMGCLVDKKGEILISGINEAVAPVTDDECELYDHIDFDMEEFAKDVGAVTLLHSCKKDILMHRWRYPSLSLHGIEGAFSGSGAKTVIPRKVVSKFSIRLVPDMVPEAVNEQVSSYLSKKFAELQSPNKFKVYMGHGGKPWVSDFNHPHYQAGRRALKTMFGVEPDLTREGGSIPVTLTF
ncbi:LOW QUALITY PROTEIN: hypothetical protein ACRRTK_020346 [Alexandromys fortis]